MHHPTDSIAHTTAFVTPVMEHWLERDIAQWVHHMKDRSNDPSEHEQTLLPRRVCGMLMLHVMLVYDDGPKERNVMFSVLLNQIMEKFPHVNIHCVDKQNDILTLSLTLNLTGSEM